MTKDSGPPFRREAGYSFYAAIFPFSVTCFILTLMADLAYWATVSILWETMSAWLLSVGLIGAGVAILAGIVDLARSRTVPGLGQPWPIVLGQAVAFGLSVINVLVHSRDGYTAVIPLGLTLSCLVVVVLLTTTMIVRARLFRTRAEGLA